MKYVFPNYDNCLVNVVCSIEKYFNVNPKHKTIEKLDKILDKNKSKNVVLFLFDGLGYNLLCQNKEICPFLYSNIVDSISSVFPSTTMAARTSIESGLNPVEHGWLGWDMYFKDFNKVITLSSNKVKGTGELAANYNVANTLLKYDSVVNIINKTKKLTGKKYKIYSDNPLQSLKKIKWKLKLTTMFKKRSYIYVYYNEPDHTLHRYGTNSIEVKNYLKEIEIWFKKICKSLKNTTVIALADHGHINVKYVNLKDYPNITKMLDGNIFIDDRTTSFRVKKEYKKIFYYELKKILKDDFIIMTKDEVIKKKLYGTGIENKYFNQGLGDYFAIGVSNKAIRYDNKTKHHISAHSGLTLDEMLVPLIVVNSNDV